MPKNATKKFAKGPYRYEEQDDGSLAPIGPNADSAPPVSADDPELTLVAVEVVFEDPATGFLATTHITTNPDGGTAPCCIVYGDKNDFGDFRRSGNGKRLP